MSVISPSKAENVRIIDDEGDLVGNVRVYWWTRSGGKGVLKIIIDARLMNVPVEVDYV